MLPESIDHEALREKTFNDTFENTYAFLKPKGDLTLDIIKKEIQTLTTTLDSMYVNEGLDWIGRGELITTKINAQIAATEVLLNELKTQLKDLMTSDL